MPLLEPRSVYVLWCWIKKTCHTSSSCFTIFHSLVGGTWLCMAIPHLPHPTWTRWPQRGWSSSSFTAPVLCVVLPELPSSPAATKHAVGSTRGYLRQAVLEVCMHDAMGYAVVTWHNISYLPTLMHSYTEMCSSRSNLKVSLYSYQLSVGKVLAFQRHSVTLILIKTCSSTSNLEDTLAASISLYGKLHAPSPSLLGKGQLSPGFPKSKIVCATGWILDLHGCKYNYK